MASCKECFHKEACFKMLEEGMGFKIPDGYEGGADRCDTYLSTADVVEVKRGEWVERDGKMWCSLCDKSNKQYKPPFCPHCGADMRGKKDEDM